MDETNDTLQADPPSREGAVAWLCALVAGAVLAALGLAVQQPFLHPPECQSEITGFPCATYVASPVPAILALVAVTSAFQAMIVHGLLRRRFALRRQGRAPQPPLWASLTAVVIVGLFVEQWLAALIVELVIEYQPGIPSLP